MQGQPEHVIKAHLRDMALRLHAQVLNEKQAADNREKYIFAYSHNPVDAADRPQAHKVSNGLTSHTSDSLRERTRSHMKK